MTGDEGMDGIWKELVGAWADLDHARHELMEAMDHAEKAAAELAGLASLMASLMKDGDGDGDGDEWTQRPRCGEKLEGKEEER